MILYAYVFLLFYFRMQKAAVETVAAAATDVLVCATAGTVAKDAAIANAALSLVIFLRMPMRTLLSWLRHL